MESVECEVKYSGVGLMALLVAAVATEGLALVIPLPPGLRACCMAYVFLQAARAVHNMLSLQGLRIDEARAVEVLDHAGRWRQGVVRDGSFVLPWLTVVRWRPYGSRLDRTVLLLPAMAPADELRKIRVLLRFT